MNSLGVKPQRVTEWSRGSAMRDSLAHTLIFGYAKLETGAAFLLLRSSVIRSK
jgi:hypothetical protein